MKRPNDYKVRSGGGMFWVIENNRFSDVDYSEGTLWGADEMRRLAKWLLRAAEWAERAKRGGK